MVTLHFKSSRKTVLWHDCINKSRSSAGFSYGKLNPMLHLKLLRVDTTLDDNLNDISDMKNHLIIFFENLCGIISEI